MVAKTIPAPIPHCRCGERATGLFHITRADGSRTNRLLCARCALGGKQGSTIALVRSFRVPSNPPPPRKPDLPRSPDFYVVRVTEASRKPSKPLVLNLESATGHDPNPEWLR